MISIISFIIVLFGSFNWLSIGFFQYDIVAGFFGYQGSLFSRIVYIIVGISACWLLFSVIKNKGRLNPQKLKRDEAPMYDKHAKMEKAVREYKEQIKNDMQVDNNNTKVQTEQTNRSQETTLKPAVVSRNHDNYSI